MRPERRAGAAGAVAVVLVLGAGCGGNGPDDSTPAAQRAHQPVHPVHVLSVSPRTLHPASPITVTYAAAPSARSPMPTLTPTLPGSWSRRGAAAIFTPARAYPPEVTVTVKQARLPGTKPRTVATRATPHGSLRRAQQILSRLRYLPLTSRAAEPTGPAATAAAVYSPPKGAFNWRYANVPPGLRAGWTPGGNGPVTRGAVISFQHDAGLPMDGSIGPKTWRALLAAAAAGKVDPHPYSFVSANLYLPQRLSVWVDGKTVVSSPVNGGVAGAPTPLGTFPIFERLPSTTMRGTNPDGSHYDDPGVPWVNYFSGGSAVHGFPRASYGSPQSVGCLELPITTARQVYSLVTYGTLVDVSGPYVAPAPVAKPAAPTKPAPKPSASSRPGTPKPSHHSSSTPTPHSSKSHH